MDNLKNSELLPFVETARWAIIKNMKLLESNIKKLKFTIIFIFFYLK